MAGPPGDALLAAAACSPSPLSLPLLKGQACRGLVAEGEDLSFFNFLPTLAFSGWFWFSPSVFRQEKETKRLVSSFDTTTFACTPGVIFIRIIVPDKKRKKTKGKNNTKMQIKALVVLLPALTGFVTAHEGESSHTVHASASDHYSWATLSSAVTSAPWSYNSSTTYDTAKPTSYFNTTSAPYGYNSTTTKKHQATSAVLTSSEEATSTAEITPTRTAATTSATGTNGAVGGRKASEFGAVVLGVAIAAGLAL